MDNALILGSIYVALEVSIVYDFIYCVRRTWSCSYFFIACMDMLFWLLSGIRVFSLLHGKGNGLLRWYVILVIFASMYVYRKYLSQYSCTILLLILGFWLQLLTKLKKICMIKRKEKGSDHEAKSCRENEVSQ